MVSYIEDNWGRFLLRGTSFTKCLQEILLENTGDAVKLEWLVA